MAQRIETVGDLRKVLEGIGDDVRFGSSYDGRPAYFDVSMFADCETHDLLHHGTCPDTDLTVAFVHGEG